MNVISLGLGTALLLTLGFSLGIPIVIKPTTASPSDRAVGGVSISEALLARATVSDRLADDSSGSDGPGGPV